MKIRLLIVLLFIWVSADSQILISLFFGDKLNSPGVEFGLEGGLNLSHMAGLEAQYNIPNIGLGFYFDIHLKNNYYLNTGLMGITKYGVSKLTDNDLNKLNIQKEPGNGNYNLVTNYFMIPILLRYKFQNHFYVEGGTQAGLLYKGTVNYVEKTDDQQINIKNKVTSEMNRIDVGAMAGMGFILRKGTGMTLGIKYYYGFTNVIKGLSWSNNRTLFIKMNIPIGRQKNKSKKVQPDS